MKKNIFLAACLALIFNCSDAQSHLLPQVDSLLIVESDLVMLGKVSSIENDKVHIAMRIVFKSSLPNDNTLTIKMSGEVEEPKLGQEYFVFARTTGREYYLGSAEKLKFS